ncbi:MAG: methyltransferase domain-containing protein [Pseudomonadota bacterium]
MPDNVRAQYATNTNLVRRANLHMAYGKRAWFPWLAKHMALPDGANVLDVGCGPGWLWRRAADSLPKGLRLTLVDTSEAMVAEATAALVDSRFEVDGVVADAMDLPFEDQVFDAVSMMHMLYHVPDVDRALAEVERVLTPGGKVCVTTNTRDNLAELTGLSGQIFGTDPFDLAAKMFSLDDAVRVLTDRFSAAERFDNVEDYHCDDPQIVMDFLLSMPPANAGSDAEKAALDTLVKEAFAEAGGVLVAQKQTGLVIATKPEGGI